MILCTWAVSHQKCRFGFPHPVKSKTTMNDVTDCLAVNPDHASKLSGAVGTERVNWKTALVVMNGKGKNIVFDKLYS